MISKLVGWFEHGEDVVIYLIVFQRQLFQNPVRFERNLESLDEYFAKVNIIAVQYQFPEG